jgi:hypothetical protein
MNKISLRIGYTSFILLSLVAFIFASCKKSEESPVPQVVSFSPESGGVGDKITITGQNFSASPKVFFNGTEATVSGTPTNSSITATVPFNASSGKIKIIANNQSVTSAKDFTVKDAYYASHRSATYVGFISSLNAGGIISSQALQVPLSPVGYEWYSDMVIYDDKIYAARGYASIVDIIELPALRIVKSVSFDKHFNFGVNVPRNIEFSNGRIFILERVLTPTGGNLETLLKAVNPDTGKVDSISLGINLPPRAMAQTNNKIFISRRLPNSQESILVLDALTLSIVGEVKVGSGVYTSMLIDKDKNVLAFGVSGEMIKIDANNYSLVSQKFIGVAGFINVENNLGGSYSNSPVSIDKDANILYFLGAAPQPASAPFGLRKYDLNTDINTLIITTFTDGSTISYDQRNKLILLGQTVYKDGTGIVQVLAVDGTLKKQIPVSSAPSEILVW